MRAWICAVWIGVVGCLLATPSAAATVPGDFPSIQAAINAVTSGALPDGTVIQVAPGTYFEALDVVTTARSLTVRCTAGAAATVINAQGRALPVVRVRFATGAVRFEGLTLTGGQADTAGGIFVHDSTNAVFAGCIVSGNQSSVDGGGALVARSVVTCDGCTILDNTANRLGGGILINEGSRLTFVNGRIQGNRSGLTDSGGAGGGALVLDSTATIRSSVITLNQSVFAGGGIHVLGQAGAAAPATLVLEDTEVSDNTTRRFAPASPPAEGGGIHIEANAQATLTRAVIRGNTADQGGGLNAFEARYDVSGSFIENNTALDAVSGLGGGISAFAFGTQPTTITLTDSVVRNNGARLGGGVLASGAEGCGTTAACMALTISGSLIDGNTSQTQGGGIYAKLGTLTLAASQVLRNAAAGTSGGQGGGGLILISAAATVTDTTFAANTAAQFGGALFVHQGSTLTVDRSNIYANTAGSGVTAGGGGIFVTRTAPLPTGVVRNSVIADNTSFEVQEEACPPLTAPLLEYRSNTLASLGGAPLYNSVCFPPGQVTTVASFNGLPSGRASGNTGGPPAFASFSATPDRGPSVLAWSVARATAIDLPDAPGPFLAPTGTVDVDPAATTTYALTATTPGGPVAATATVTRCRPTVAISRSASVVRPGQALTVGIQADNPGGCTAADLYAGVLLPGGAARVTKMPPPPAVTPLPAVFA